MNPFGTLPARTPEIALAGNPNAGKTTLFNRLTGRQGRVGNYPGVTVELLGGVEERARQQRLGQLGEPVDRRVHAPQHAAHHRLATRDERA